MSAPAPRPGATGSVMLSREGEIAVLRFDNPNRGFMDEGTEAGLTAALDRIEGDETIRAVVLTGARPGMFIRHYDTQLLAARAEALAARGMRFDTARPVPEPVLHRDLRRIETSPKPFIAAINGTAMGGGFELALACDLRLAEAGEYPIGLPETCVGLLPGAGGTQRLAALIGRAAALDVILRGRTFLPGEAARRGLVGECVPAPVLDHAMAIARDLASLPARALAHVKRLTRAPLPDPQVLADERTLFCDLMVSEEARARMARMNAGAGDIRDPDA